MAESAPILIDRARFDGLETIPLALIGDLDPATPDLSLRGVLPSDGSYGYRLALKAGVSYRFQSPDVGDGFAERAVLIDTASREVVWANAAAGRSLGLSAEAASALAASVISPRADATRVLLLTGSAAGEAGGDPFLFQAFVDDPPPPPLPTANEIFRFVKLSNGMYFYTASAAERDSIAKSFPDLRFEGPVFIGDDVARDGFVPVYRFANLANGGYYYTADAAEREAILHSRPQLRAEGISFYVPGTASADTTPVFRLMNLDTGGYLFTTNAAEKLYALLKGGWRDDGIAFHSLRSLSSGAKAEGHGGQDAASAPTDTTAHAVPADAVAGLPAETGTAFDPSSLSSHDIFGLS